MPKPKYWYKNGGSKPSSTYSHKLVLHRLDGPAVIKEDGSEHWYQNGLLHRLDGPAYNDLYLGKRWYKDGKLHRLDGPAIDESNWFKVDQQWWVDGVQIKCISNTHFLRLMKLKAFL